MKTLYFLLISLLFTGSLLAQSQVPVMNPIQGSSTVCSTPASSKGYTASASNNPSFYTWMVFPSTGVVIGNSSGAVTTISFPNTNSTYTIYCTASNAFGTSQPVMLIVTVFETPTVTFSGINSFCQGSSTNLSASPTIISASSTLSYTWAPTTGLTPVNSLNVNANPSVTTTYTLNMAIGSCTNSDVMTVSVNPTPTLNVTTTPTVTCPNQNATLKITGSATGYTTVNTNNNSTNAIINPPSTIQYTVNAINGFGCKATAKYTHNVNCVGIEENFNNNQFNIYPNPNNGSFYINAKSEGKATIFNQLGQSVSTVRFGKDEKVAVTGLLPGIYFIRNETVTFRIIVTE